TLTAGEVIKLRGEFAYSTVAATTPNLTIQFKFNFGGSVVTLASSSAQSMAAGAGNVPSYFELYIVVRSIGASGVVSVGGHYQFLSSTGKVDFYLGSLSTVTVDTTIQNT